jgi:hypothetical protein
MNLWKDSEPMILKKKILVDIKYVYFESERKYIYTPRFENLRFQTSDGQSMILGICYNDLEAIFLFAILL